MSAPASPLTVVLMSVPVSDVSDVSEESGESLPAEPVSRGPVAPDRADAPVSEVVERFLRAVVADVPIGLIEELHLFSPLRQGTVETGIAVLAARRPFVAPSAEELEPEHEAAPELALDAVDGGEDVEPEDATDTEATVDAALEPAVETAADASAADASVVEAPAVEAPAVEAPAVEAPAVDASAVYSSEPPTISPPERHTVFTARYRYVIKGPERGKWESSVKAEADAPLITVETVVRGVQRRAGEESEIVRYTGAQIARALRIDLQG